MGKEDLVFLTMDSAPTFVPFSVQHLLALLCIATLAAGAVVLGHRVTPSSRNRGALALAVLWGGAELYWVLTSLDACDRIRDCLPLHLCDLSVAMTVLALVTHRQIPFEFAYFFGIGGTLQALFTPDLPFGFPTESYFRFFIGHGGIIISVAYLIAAFSLRPTRASVIRMIAVGYAYILAIGAFNWLADTNYAYICRKPSNPSLFDRLGPWPWYVLLASLIAVANILLLYLPYWWMDRRAKRIQARTE
ncbi:MAG: TIGR02206 family membrane protein [Candidatus Sumerlaeaceae bacterium]